MSKHTPGPWRTGPINYADVYGANGDLVALIIKDCKNTEANARLISAAPELFEACKHMLDFCPSGLLPDLKAAIAKAEGPQGGASQ